MHILQTLLTGGIASTSRKGKEKATTDEVEGDDEDQPETDHRPTTSQG